MKRQLIVMASLLMASGAYAGECGKTSQLRFFELPFAEGKLFVSVTCGDTTVLANAVEIEEENLIIPADLSSYHGNELHVQAFQDLNGNNTLDFDGYGRPTEPCLRTVITPDAETTVIDLQLVQY